MLIPDPYTALYDVFLFLYIYTHTHKRLILLKALTGKIHANAISYASAMHYSFYFSIKRPSTTVSKSGVRILPHSKFHQKKRNNNIIVMLCLNYLRNATLRDRERFAPK